MDITQIIVALIGLLGLLLTGIILPLVRAKLTETQWETVKSWTKTAVAAAEVIFKGTGRGDEKRDFVLNWLKKMCAEKGVKFDEDAVKIALEDAWRGLSGAEKNEFKFVQK